MTDNHHSFPWNIHKTTILLEPNVFDITLYHIIANLHKINKICRFVVCLLQSHTQEVPCGFVPCCVECGIKLLDLYKQYLPIHFF